MKAFFRTVWGKVLLTLICVLSVLTLIVCAGGAAVTVSAENGRIRMRSQEEMIESLLGADFRAQAYNCLDLYVKKWQSLIDDTELDFRIWSGEDKLVYKTEGNTSGTGYSYTFYYVEGRIAGYGGLYSDEPDLNPAYYERYTVSVIPKNVDSPYRTAQRFIDLVSQLGWWIFAVGLAALILIIVSFVSLMRVSARRPGRDDLVPGPLNPVPYDILLAVCAAGMIGILYFVDWILPLQDSTDFKLAGAAVVLALLVLIGLSMSAAARIKTRTLLSNTLIARILKLLAKPFIWLFGFLKKLFQNLPLVWKTALALGILALVEVFVILASRRIAEIFWLDLVKWLILIPAVLYLVLCLRRLQKGGEALAAGDLAYRTDTKGLPVDLKKHAEDLNSIGGGMAIAVKEQLKSERMKTELITNVSHDLKTPLTSLINYADLISKESCDNPKITEYSAVLLRQSERLKRLIDDLVEASKASTGNLDVDLEPCDASVFLAQAAGEYGEKLQKAGLTLITKQPEQEVRIMADGRRMWRIFDNLMSNIVKYSLAGTRVYLSLEQEGGDAVITFRNTSREPLDAVNAEELTERFTRGDASRNTEGSGLGLAIAKSLTELQGGSFAVSADGDLFKAVMRFPTVQEA